METTANPKPTAADLLHAYTVGHTLDLAAQRLQGRRDLVQADKAGHAAARAAYRAG